MADTVDTIIEQWRRERPDLDTWTMGVVGRLQRLARVLDREQREFFVQYGVELWEMDVLTTLRRSGEPYGLTVGAIRRSGLFSSGPLTHRIGRMEAKGLVERVREPADRRSVVIRLTPHGHEVVDELFERYLENQTRLLGALGPGERDRLTDVLRSLLESLEDTAVK